MTKQSFNDGVVKFCRETNTASPGDTPKYNYTERYSLRFADRTIGLKRQFYAQQNNIHLERLIRCLSVDITTNDVAFIEGKPFKIGRIQHPEGHVPKIMDVELSRLEAKYGGG